MDCLSLKEIKKSISKIKRLKKHCTYKDHLYHNLNRRYKTLDWSKDKFNNAEMKEAFVNTALPVQRKMRNYGWLKYYPNNNMNDGYYLRYNVEHLFLLNELMCQADDEYWLPEPKQQSKIEYKPFHFNSAYRGDVYLFSYPVSKEWKAELLTDFLHKKEFLFDEDSPHWKGMKKLRYFCLKNLMNSKVEKWEYQVQRFLAKKD